MIVSLISNITNFIQTKLGLIIVLHSSFFIKMINIYSNFTMLLYFVTWNLSYFQKLAIFVFSYGWIWLSCQYILHRAELKGIGPGTMSIRILSLAERILRLSKETLSLCKRILIINGHCCKALHSLIIICWFEDRRAKRIIYIFKLSFLMNLFICTNIIFCIFLTVYLLFNQILQLYFEFIIL